MILSMAVLNIFQADPKVRQKSIPFHRKVLFRGKERTI